jgi:hypothetical protein
MMGERENYTILKFRPLIPYRNMGVLFEERI